MFSPAGSHVGRLICAAIVISLMSFVDDVRADGPEPLHQQIDRLVSQQQLTEVAGADDLSFLRRINLDLAGRIPTVSEARAFAADASATKRATLIDRLLVSDEFPKQWATVLDVMFMERRSGKHVKTDEFRKWLSESLKANKPINKLCAELVAADGTPEKQRAASAFFLERAAEPNLMARETGRMFFGQDLQCAQCHDHPLIADYHQADYFGLYAFVSRTTIFQPDKKKPALLAESAEGLAPFKSVFTARESLTQPRLPDEGETADPFFEPGSEYAVAPAKNVRQIPRYSRREKLAELIGSGENRLFRRNIANRIWAVMLGRGIVHPVDLHHSENPPSNPELLDLISEQFAGMDFNLRDFVRQIALSKAYQTSFARSSSTKSDSLKQQQDLLQAEIETTQQAAETIEVRVDTGLEKVDAAFARVTPLRTAWEKSHKTARDLATKRDAAAKTLTARQTTLASKTIVRDSLQQSDSATRSAATALNDADLTKLADQFKKLAATAEAATRKLTTEVSKLETALAAEKKKFEPAKSTALADYAKLKPHLEELKLTRGELIAARYEVYAHETRATFLGQRQEELNGLITAHDQSTRIQATTASLATNVASLAGQLAELKQRASEVAVAAKTLDETTAAMQQQEVQRAALAKAGSSLQQSLRLLAETTQQIQNSLTADEEVDGMIAELTSASARLKAQVAQVRLQSQEAQNLVTNSLELISQQETRVAKTEAGGLAQQTAVNTTQKKISQQTTELKSLKSARQQSADALLEPAVRRLEIPVLQALTPEQFCWSVLYATDQVDRQIVAARAKLDKKQPLKPEELKDSARVRQRDQEARLAAMTAMQKIVDRFVKLFAAQSGQPQGDFFATADQALFTSNGGELRSWLNPVGGNLTDRLIKTENAQAFADELYLAVFTRQPETTEVKAIEDYLSAEKDKRTATQEIVWAMLTSVEFRFQQ
jgi:hypothetical protein